MFAQKQHSQGNHLSVRSLPLRQGTQRPAAHGGGGAPRCAGSEGFAALALLFMLAGVGALSLAHLSKVVAEHKRARVLIAADRARALAEGELERAKNIVNAAPYVGVNNTALTAAIAANPPFIAGTAVETTRVGAVDSEYFMLRASATWDGVTKTAQVFVRQRSPVSAYNYFVIDHPLGISGAPRGAIHSNRSVDFYFPNGLYRDQVTAGEGFNFRAGATAGNTRLVGPTNPSAPTFDILDGTTMTDMAAHADTLAVTDALVAEVEFQGANTEVRLFNPGHPIDVERNGTRSVFDHFESTTIDVQEPRYTTQHYDVQEPVYTWESYTVTVQVPVYRYDDVTRTRQDPVYEDHEVTYTERVPVYATRIVERDVLTRRWVEDPPPTMQELEGGYAVGGREPELGHWEWVTTTETVEEQYIASYRDETRTRTERVQVGTTTVTWVERVRSIDHYDSVDQLRWRQVQTGTRTVTRSRQVFSHYETVTRTVQRPVYRDEPYTWIEQVWVPEEHVATHSVSTQGLIYIEGDVRSIQGQVDGQISLATNSKATITGSLVYVDGDGRTRMLNGTDPSERYTFNQEYTGNSVLGIMARDDIRYAVDVPTRLEINASLISTEGMVGFTGIGVSGDGTIVTLSPDASRPASDYIKESIRRLGGIVSRQRPVTTYVDATNTVLAGFERGMSFMDRNLMIRNGGNAAPPFVFQENRPVWALTSAGRIFDAH